jgi:hypothetical protein
MLPPKQFSGENGGLTRYVGPQTQNERAECIRTIYRSCYLHYGSNVKAQISITVDNSDFAQNLS